MPDAELVRLYQTAGVMVLPLLDATANNSLLEAIACGVPLVTTDVGGVRDYVDDRCAVIVAPGDAEGMCQAVVELMADDERRREMARAARQRALEFDWPHVAQAHLEVYRRLL
jgi:glycosyltransferase involved in cell wall biosynthesis